MVEIAGPAYNKNKGFKNWKKKIKIIVEYALPSKGLMCLLRLWRLNMKKQLEKVISELALFFPIGH